MRLYGALSELAELVIRLASGKTVKVSSENQPSGASEKVVKIPDMGTTDEDKIVLETSQQTVTNKTLTGVVTNGTSNVKVQNADITGTNQLQLPGTQSTSLRYLTAASNKLYLGTGTNVKEIVDLDSAGQVLSGKTINASTNSLVDINPASGSTFATIAGHADKVVKYDAGGIPQVAKLVNANIDDAANISGSKLSDNSVSSAKLTSMTSAQLAGLVTDETGSGALVFANNPTIGSVTAASGILSIAGTGALKVPAGLGSERPASPVEGMIRYNSETDSFEGYASDTWSGLGGGGTVDRITQATHGFVVGDVLWLNGSTYAKAKADAANTAEVVGMVSRVIDANNFEMTLSGEVSGLTGLTAGEVYFLSAATAGAMTITEPSVVGQVSLPVGVASSTTSLYVAPKRGVVVGGANLRTQIGLNGAALVSQTTNIQNVTAYTAGELTGWVYIDATTDRRFYIQVQFVKDAANAWKASYQTTGDTPPQGFNVDVIVSGSDAFVQVQMPPVAGWLSGSVNFALNAPAVGATLPLQVDSANVSFTDIKAASAAGITFKEDGGTTTMTITDAGNVGIGTSSPDSLTNTTTLTLNNNINATRISLKYNNTDGAYISSDSSKALYFGANAAERMRIESDGRLRVMAASSGGEAAIFTNSIASNPYGLTVNFSGADPNNTTQWVFRAAASATNIYTIWSNGTVTARSDIRYKQDITPARNYLADLNQLEVVNYRWKSNPDGNKELGFIAQQVESIMPGLVLTEKEGDNECKSIKVSVLTPMLVKAIQEQQAQIEELKAKLAALEAK